MRSTTTSDRARRLVERQLRKAGLGDETDPRIRQFVDMVYDSYGEFDRHRRLTDHSTRLASEELAETIASLGASERLFRSLVRSSPNGIMYADAEGRCLYVNEQTERLLDRPADELMGFGWLDGIGEVDRRFLRNATDQSRELGDSTIESRMEHSDGRTLWLSTTVAFVEDPDRPNVPAGWVATIEDITERKRFERELSNLALRDSLTDLENRYSLSQQLADRCDELGSGRELAVAVIDLDRFKMVNDTFGHDAGDMLLVGVASKLRTAATDDDVVARLGGDEFAFVRWLSADEGPDQLGRFLSSVIHGPVDCGGRSLHVGGSVGVAVSGSAGSTPAELLRNADVAMYRAKRSSISTSEVYDERFRDDAANRFDLETDVRGAIADRAFTMVYQPIVDTSTNRVVAVEAFARLDLQRMGPVSPATFVSVAEDVGLASELGEQLLDSACRDFRTWRDADARFANVVLSVNISTLQLADPGFVDVVGSVVDRHRLRHSDLMFEITERAFGAYVDQSIAALEAIRAEGGFVVIDDFGTGYSSLADLRRLPVDFVKIDGSFVAEIGQEERDDEATDLIHAIIELAANLGLTPIAECVETQAQRQALLDAGCPLMQGHLIAVPLPPGDARLIKALGLEPDGNLAG